MQPTMELEHTRAAAAHPSWRTAASPNVLAAIREPAINLTCWERTLPTGIEDALVDAVPERGLITTYAGPGTEWLPNEAVNRVAMGHPDDCPCDSSESIVRAGASARRANAGDVLLMRGASKGGALGLVHRSPPIEALGRRRVVLVLSTVERT